MNGNGNGHNQRISLPEPQVPPGGNRNPLVGTEFNPAELETLIAGYLEEKGWTPPSPENGENGENAPLETHSDWPHSGSRWTRCRWIIPGWLPAGRVTALAGHGGAGKTRIALQMAAAIALGSEQAFLATSRAGSPALNPEQCGPVLWASWETAPGDFQDRLEAATEDIASLQGKLHYANLRPEGAIWGPPPGQHISTAAGPRPTWRKLTQAAEETGAALLVIDPLAAAYASNENDRSLVRPFLSALADWADRTGCGALLVSHPPKSGADYAGSTDWLAGVQALWTLDYCPNQKCPHCAEDRARILSVKKVNEGPLPEPLYARWSEARRNLVLDSHENGTQPPRRRPDVPPAGLSIL